jgi:hypothetical protein
MNTSDLDRQLNAMVLEGKAMEAFEQFYADGVSMQENNDPPTVGKDANRQREIQFFSSVETLHSNRLLASAVAGDVSFSEWEWDVTFKGGMRLLLCQVAVRRWKDGKVASERFYYNKG